MHDWFIIFGAKINRDGSPSGSVARRVRAALAASAQSTAPMFLPTGGRGKSGHFEAEVMQRLLLESGVPPEQIVCEKEAHDTLTSARYCARILGRRSDVARVFACSDDYHQPRCRLLLRIAGIQTSGIPIESSLRAEGALKYVHMVTREAAAILLDPCWLGLLQALKR